MMTPLDYSFESGIKTEQDYDAAIALISELRNSKATEVNANLADSMLKLACLIEKFERERYLVFFRGYTC